jgi:hypothetical protein
VNWSGALADAAVKDQPAGADVRQAAEQDTVAGLLPSFVLASVTTHASDVHAMGLPPLFFTVREIASGAEEDEEPPTTDAPTTVMLVFEAALFTRL